MICFIFANLFLQSGTSPFETGGAGTVFVESISPEGEILKQKLTINNNGRAYPKAHVIAAGDRRHILDGIYEDISDAGGITWLDQEGYEYSFEELDVGGNAHMAILSDSWNTVVKANVTKLWGDKSGVIHVGMNQTMFIYNVDIYLPINLAAYRYVFVMH